ncbi:MAG: zinc ribbon domain-containing protein [Anaerolineales bacterium]|nr:zinc ribbon domain-containing protein [Anaerolineales bacterium]
MSKSESPLKGFRPLDGSSGAGKGHEPRPEPKANPPKKLTDRKPAPRPQRRQPFSAAEFCSECGFELSSATNFCVNCGEPIEPSGQISEPLDAPQLRNRPEPFPIASANKTHHSARNVRSLKNEFGVEVISFSTIFTLQGSKADLARNALISQIVKRNIPGAETTLIENGDRQYFVVSKKMKPDAVLSSVRASEIASTLICLESYGNDLLLEVKHYELSPRQTGRSSGLGAFVFAIGLLFFWTGIGLVALIAGFGMLRGKSPFNDDSPEREKSKLLFQAVMGSLEFALSKADVELDPSAIGEF